MGDLGDIDLSRAAKMGAEARKNYERRVREGIISKYLSGDNILDIGGGAYEPIVEHAMSVDTHTPDYDGVRLPYADNSIDGIFSSHCLEHVEDPCANLVDWYRVLKNNSHMVIAVSHAHLYERTPNPPSRFNADHRRYYTPVDILWQIENALPIGGWRLNSSRDIDDGFSYDTPPEEHATGCYEIEVIVKKIPVPFYADQLYRGF